MTKEKENKKEKSKSEKIAQRGMLIAVAFVLSWLESQLPVFVAVPGVKIGLTNLVVLVALYHLGTRDAVVLNVLRILLVGLTFGNLFSLLYSLAGGILSAAAMIFLKKTGKFSMTGVSVAGGIAHNVGQILVAMVVLESSGVLYYLGVLWISGMVAGIIVGILGSMVTKRLF
jgi:heptaprenyl diphosphate synthase